MVSDLIAGFEAFGTLMVAIAAIWGDWLRAKLLPPSVRVELSDPEGQRISQQIMFTVGNTVVVPFTAPGNSVSFALPAAGTTPGVTPAGDSIEARYYHLRLINEKPFAVAHKTQIVIVRLEGKGPAGQPQEIYRVPLPLTWRNQRELDPSPWRDLGAQSHEADLLFVREDGQLLLTPMVFPSDFPGSYKEPVVLWATIQAQFIEGVSKPLRVKIAWDGKWEHGDAEMKKHLQVIPEHITGAL